MKNIPWWSSGSCHKCKKTRTWHHSEEGVSSLVSVKDYDPPPLPRGWEQSTCSECTL